MATNDYRVATDDHRVATNDRRLATNDHRVVTNDNRLATNDHRVATNDYRVATNHNRVSTNDYRLATNEHHIGFQWAMIHYQTSYHPLSDLLPRIARLMNGIVPWLVGCLLNVPVTG